MAGCLPRLLSICSASNRNRSELRLAFTYHTTKIATKAMLRNYWTHTHTHTCSRHTLTHTHAAPLTCNANSQHAATCRAHKSRALGPWYPALTPAHGFHLSFPAPPRPSLTRRGRCGRSCCCRTSKVRQFEWRLQVAATSHVFFFFFVLSSSPEVVGTTMTTRLPLPLAVSSLCGWAGQLPSPRQPPWLLLLPIN